MPGRRAGLVGHIRGKYGEWGGGAWTPVPWRTIATSGASGNPHASDHVFGVKDVRFALCGHTSGQGDHNCASLAWAPGSGARPCARRGAGAGRRRASGRWRRDGVVLS